MAFELEKLTDQKLADLTEDVVRRVRETLNLNVDKIILYGSYARGDADEESDVDIMILCDNSHEEIHSCNDKIVRIGSDLCMDHNVEVSLYFKDKDTFDKWHHVLPYYQNIIKDGIALYG